MTAASLAAALVPTGVVASSGIVTAAGIVSAPGVVASVTAAVVVRAEAAAVKRPAEFSATSAASAFLLLALVRLGRVLCCGRGRRGWNKSARGLAL